MAHGENAQFENEYKKKPSDLGGFFCYFYFGLTPSACIQYSKPLKALVQLKTTPVGVEYL